MKRLNSRNQPKLLNNPPPSNLPTLAIERANTMIATKKQGMSETKGKSLMKGLKVARDKVKPKRSKEAMVSSRMLLSKTEDEKVKAEFDNQAVIAEKERIELKLRKHESKREQAISLCESLEESQSLMDTPSQSKIIPGFITDIPTKKPAYKKSALKRRASKAKQEASVASNKELTSRSNLEKVQGEIHLLQDGNPVQLPKEESLVFARDAENGLSYEKMVFETTRLHPHTSSTN
eukprot:TRINITY_DN22643_c0_g1_i1.p1 TRINITY_DN22643_c0_g1~~TRINITY_DN22643_c0_g1_i1.p1  ORF type:complete len:235 (-),score=33.22 TRINITY_DN22643_c0_g1_i1:145-849(-)